MTGEPEAPAVNVCSDFHMARWTSPGPGAGPEAAHEPGAFCLVTLDRALPLVALVSSRSRAVP